MKKQMSLFLVLISCYVLRPELTSKPRSCGYASSERNFYNELRRYKAAVILFSNEPQRGKNAYAGDIKRTFQRLAKSGYYPRNAVRFMHMHSTDPKTIQFARDNHIDLAQLPAVVLFSNGVPLEDQHGMVMLRGNPSRDQLKKFIDDYLTIDIAEFVQEERAFKQYQDIIRDRAHVYYTPYFSRTANPWNDWWGWPYYGQAQGNYGGNVGVNFFASNY